LSRGSSAAAYPAAASPPFRTNDDDPFDERWSFAHVGATYRVCCGFRLNSSSPPATTSVATANQAKQQEKYNGSDKGIDDQGDNPDPEVNTQPRQQPIANEGADQTDQQVSNESKAATLHHPARQIAGNDSDNDDDEEALVG
jgi:hypothetical protein